MPAIALLRVPGPPPSEGIPDEFAALLLLLLPSSSSPPLVEAPLRLWSGKREVLVARIFCH